MKPIIGQLTYKDMRPEDIERVLNEANALRSQVICGMIADSGRRVISLFKSAAKPSDVVKTGNVVGA